MFRILVADDDKNTRILLKAVLEGEGYTVLLAEDGALALKALEREHIDLVVLDIMMPHMDGYEFTEALRESGSELPILMVSGQTASCRPTQGVFGGYRRLHHQAHR